MPELATVSRWVTDAKASFAALAEGGKQIHLGSLQIERGREVGARALKGEERERAVRVLRDHSDILELHEVLCAFFEAQERIRDSGSTDLHAEDSLRRAIEIVRASTGLEPEEVLERSERLMPEPADRTPGAEKARANGLGTDRKRTLLSIAASAVSASDPKLVDDVATACGRQALAHRCRLAREWLRAFVLRNGSEQRSQVNIAGEAFVEGRLSIIEVAGIIGAPVEEAILLLEQYGYSRSVTTIRLDKEERQERLLRIRNERLSRGGRPQADEQSIARTVIASHRIEDLDARPWIPTIPLK